MPRAILHRGSWHNNRAFGVLHGFLHPPYWCETDVLWTGQAWVLAHDSETYLTACLRTDTLTEIMRYISLLRLSEPADSHRYLLLDVKWQEVFNASHSREDALTHLAEAVALIRSDCLWLQFTDLAMYRLATRHPILQVTRLGFLVESALGEASTEILTADFVMIALDRYPPSAVRDLRKRASPEGSEDTVIILGYTCPSLGQWHAYSFLYNDCLDGLVVAVP